MKNDFIFISRKHTGNSECISSDRNRHSRKDFNTNSYQSREEHNSGVRSFSNMRSPPLSEGNRQNNHNN